MEWGWPERAPEIRWDEGRALGGGGKGWRCAVWRKHSGDALERDAMGLEGMARGGRRGMPCRGPGYAEGPDHPPRSPLTCSAPAAPATPPLHPRRRRRRRRRTSGAVTWDGGSARPNRGARGRGSARRELQRLARRGKRFIFRFQFSGAVSVPVVPVAYSPAPRVNKVNTRKKTKAVRTRQSWGRRLSGTGRSAA